MRWAIWGHLWTDTQREGGRPAAIVERCRASGIELYLPHTYPIAASSRGYFSPGITYASRLFALPVHDLLTPLLAAAHAARVRVQPWLLPFVTELQHGESAEELFPRRAYQSAEFARAGAGAPPDGAAKDGKVLCPTWPENRARAVRALHDLLAAGGPHLTGINLDMVRYPNADVSWDRPCHCQACRREYLRLFGTDTLRPEDLRQPAVAYLFARMRNACIRALVEEIRDITRGAGLELTVSARAHYYEAAVLEGQDWVAWARDGLVDAVLTMNYTADRAAHATHVQLHGRLMRQQQRALHYDGVGRGSSMGENPIEAVLTLARDSLAAGADGVSIFHYNAMRDDDFRRLADLA